MRRDPLLEVIPRDTRSCGGADVGVRRTPAIEFNPRFRLVINVIARAMRS